MGGSRGWTPRLEVIVDTGRLGEVKAIRGDGVDFVCSEAEVVLQLVIASGLSFSLEVNAPELEHDQIHARLQQFAASLGRDGEPWANQFGSPAVAPNVKPESVGQTIRFDEPTGGKPPSRARVPRRLHG